MLKKIMSRTCIFSGTPLLELYSLSPPPAIRLKIFLALQYKHPLLSFPFKVWYCRILMVLKEGFHCYSYWRVICDFSWWIFFLQKNVSSWKCLPRMCMWTWTVHQMWRNFDLLQLHLFLLQLKHQVCSFVHHDSDWMHPLFPSQALSGMEEKHKFFF